jgi:benzoate/toluate 1,2-dioxygenase subunit beta
MNQPPAETVEEFLYREATYLDQADLESWIQLFTEDGTYWMPAMHEQPDPMNHISHIYDDRVLMEIRKRNFIHPRAPSQQSPVQSSHLIANIREAGTTSIGERIIHSNFHIVMWYREEQHVFAGTYQHHLQSIASGFLIKHKKVQLINPEAAQKSIIIYL